MIKSQDFMIKYCKLGVINSLISSYNQLAACAESYITHSFSLYEYITIRTFQFQKLINQNYRVLIHSMLFVSVNVTRAGSQALARNSGRGDLQQ